LIQVPVSNRHVIEENWQCSAFHDVGMSTEWVVHLTETRIRRADTFRDFVPHMGLSFRKAQEAEIPVRHIPVELPLNLVYFSVEVGWKNRIILEDADNVVRL
jgi:hypothetical protein